MKKIFSLVLAVMMVASVEGAYKRVILHENGGENTSGGSTLVTDVGSSILVPDPIRAGYTFNGWTSSNNYPANLCLMESLVPGKAFHEEIIFDGNTYYDLGRTHMYTDYLTLNLWAYMDNWADYEGRRMISCTEGGGIGFEPSGATTKHINFKGHDGAGYKDAKSTSTLSYADLAAGWHMFTLTFDGHNIKGFVDGNLVAIGPHFTSDTLYYNATNSILLGAEPLDGNKPAGTPCYFIGKMRDISIVRAALSVSGVKDLYDETKALNNNNPHVRRYVMPTSSKTLKASWKANPSTTLTIDANGGKNTMAKDTYSQAAGKALTITSPTRAGYTFTSWDKTTSQYISNYQGMVCSSPEEVTFNGTSTYYALGRDYMYEDVITVNVWAYMDKWADYATAGMRLFSCTEGGGWNIEPNANGQIQYVIRDNGIGYKTFTLPMLWSELKAGWHMFTLTFDGSRAHGYVDGVLMGSSKLFQSGKIGYHATNGILIGAEPADGNQPHSTTPRFFKGKMKNFAIMHTAVTSDEVAFLYANPGVDRQYFPATAHTLKAVWQANPSATLTIDANGGVNTMAKDSYSQVAGTALTLTNPTRTNHAFVNWDKATSKNIINYQGYTCSSPEEVTFNGTSTHYDLGREYMYEDAITINLWAYMDNWADYANGMRLFSCTQGGGLNMEGSTSITFAGYDKGIGYKNAKASQGWSGLASGWHMVTYVFDGINVRGYIDGQLVATSANYASGQLGYHATNHLLIGAEAYNGAGLIESNPRYFKGKIKNFGIVPTALSAEEVALLYATPAVARYYFTADNQTLKATWKSVTTPTITTDQTTLRFVTTEGTTAANQAITVSTANLKGDITTTLGGANANSFEIATSSLAQTGGTITISYKETTIGSHTATLTLSAVGATNQTVTLQGVVKPKEMTPPDTPADGITGGSVSASKAFLNFVGTHGDTNAPFEEVVITNTGTSEVNVNPSSSLVSVTKLDGWDAQIGGTIRITLNTNQNPGEYTSYVAVQSGPAVNRVEIQVAATINPDSGSTEPGQEGSSYDFTATPMLEKVWDTDSVLPVANVRYGVGYQGEIYAADISTKTLYSWHAQDATQTKVVTGVGGGFAILSDNAGHLLVSKNGYATSATSWQIVDLTSSEVTELALSIPLTLTSSSYVHANVALAGNLAANAMLFMAPNGHPDVVKVTLANGAQMASTIAATVTNNFSHETTLALRDVAYDAITNEPLLWRVRNGNLSYLWSNDVKNIAQPTTKSSNTGLATFQLNNIEYAIIPTGLYMTDGFSVFNLSTGEVVGERPNSTTVTTDQYSCFNVEKVSEGTVNIYFYKSGISCGMYTFSYPKKGGGVLTNNTTIENCTFGYYMAANTLFVTGVEAKQIDLYSLSGQKLCTARDTNMIHVPIDAGVYVAHIVDTYGVCYAAKVMVR